MACLHGRHRRSSRRSSWSQSRPHRCALVLILRVWSRRCCAHGRSHDPLPQRGCGAFPGTGIGSGDAASSDWLLPSEGSRPPAPGAAEKRTLGMQGIRLDQNTLKIQLAKELPQHRSFVVIPGGVAGLADRHAQCRGVERHLGNVDAVGRRPYADPSPAVGSIEPLKVLPSQTSWSRSPAPPGI
jgi:hypothetical protein